jgi:hypothetical protein
MKVIAVVKAKVIDFDEIVKSKSENLRNLNVLKFTVLNK